MTAIKAALYSCALCAVFGGILKYLSLSDSMKKLLGIIITTAIAVLALRPFADSTISFDEFSVEIQETRQTTEDTLMHLAGVLEKDVKSKVKDVLINCGVDEYEIYVTTATDKENETVSLISLKIEVGEQYSDNIRQIVSVLKDEFGEVLKVDVKS